jgi:ferredoxin
VINVVEPMACVPADPGSGATRRVSVVRRYLRAGVVVMWSMLSDCPTTRVDPAGGLAEQPVDRDFSATFCAACGACLATCPAVKFGLNFDPRAIVFKLRYGLADRLLIDDSVVWQCFQCHRCAEVCSQPVKPGEIIGWLRGLLKERVHGGALGG